MTKAWAKRRETFNHETEHDFLFRVWCTVERLDEISDAHTRDMFEKWYGFAPQFIRDALDRWGGLTPKQLAFARTRFSEVYSTGRDRYEARQQERAALIATGEVWTPGRTEVHMEVLCIKERMWGPKLLGKTLNGLKLWVSVPANVAVAPGARLKMTVTVTPSADDPTFAFGARPTKCVLL
jgi:hypothetical protein